MVSATSAQEGRVSEHEFSTALSGCWGSEWHAQLVDGRETGGGETVCFETDGLLVIEIFSDSEMNRTRGTYALHGGKLHLETSAGSTLWDLGVASLICDATIMPGEDLKLTGCVAGESQPDRLGNVIEDRSYRAIDVRERQMATALLGCWHRDPTPEMIEYEKNGGVISQQICFSADGQVETAWVDGSVEAGLHGVGSGGTFELVDGRLKLDGEGDGWFLAAYRLSCDVVLQPDVAMQLKNCFSPGNLHDDASFSRVAP